MVISEYGSIFSIVLFGYLLIPAVLLGLWGKKIKYYGMLVSLPALYLLIGSHKLPYFIGFLIFEVFLLYLYLFIHKRTKNDFFYALMFLLSFIPLVYARLVPYTHWHPLEILGISYMGFRIWQMIIEIHDNHVKSMNLFNLLYFISFFTTLSSGPIDRYKRFLEDIAHAIERKTYIHDFLLPGIEKIFYGLVYKFGIASLINIYLMEKIPAHITLVHSLEYMYVYTFYLFFDFAGYSLLAVGMSYMLGVKAPDNFNKPFLAKDMKDFWQRWHISLSRWFGDYLFGRFVLAAVRHKWTTNISTATRWAYMVTMTTMGVWHGFTLYYIIYGVYQGLALVATDVYLKSKWHRKQMKKKHFVFVSRLVTFHVFAFGLLIFSGYLFTGK